MSIRWARTPCDGWLPVPSPGGYTPSRSQSSRTEGEKVPPEKEKGLPLLKSQSRAPTPQDPVGVPHLAWGGSWLK